MVKIKGFKAYRPINLEEFCTLPYDVIDEKMEKELKKNPNSAIHIILPDGDEEEKYRNAKRALDKFIQQGILYQEEKECIYFYRQEALSDIFFQEGFIFAVSIDDYEQGNIKKHEHTREAPLKDRTNHIKAVKMNTGLVWTIYSTTKEIAELVTYIKGTPTEAVFEKYGYKQILWKCDNPEIIGKIKNAFENVTLYIADGHHRAAAATEYRKIMKEELKDKYTGEENFNYFMTYAACEDVVHILPYNRVIKKIPIDKKQFLSAIMDVFVLEILDKEFMPLLKGEIGMLLDDQWYRLILKKEYLENNKDLFDTEILQKYILDPILRIKDIRKSENIEFVGGITDPKGMKKYIKEKGYDIFFSLCPVSPSDIKKIADKGEVMPPKSTWFEPKLLTGLVFNPLF
ncbi:MAG: DUF1015 domain-containing protein [Promethearchaeota archaeon]